MFTNRQQEMSRFSEKGQVQYQADPEKKKSCHKRLFRCVAKSSLQREATDLDDDKEFKLRTKLKHATVEIT
jgi:hypothetical protein